LVTIKIKYNGESNSCQLSVLFFDEFYAELLPFSTVSWTRQV